MGCYTALCISALFSLFSLFYSFDAIDTITRTLFISDSENGSLVSSDGNFKLGFFSPGNSRARYVGIWFNKISQHTVVWVANRDNPIKNSAGIFKIGGDGNLAVFTCCNESRPLWSTNVSVPTSNSSAKLLDSGNLVLVAKNKWSNTETVIWQSFDHPTDTLLAGMKFGFNQKNGLSHVLTSWKSRDDPAPGDTSSRVDPRGSPQLFLYKKSIPKWRAGSWNGHNMNGLPDIATRLRGHNADQTDLINITLMNNDNETYIMFHPKKGALSLIRLDPMGSSNRLVWDPSREYWVKFGSVPGDFCDEYARCGANAICTEDTLIRCACLPGFEPSYPQDWYLKCAEARKKDGCGKGDGEGFVKMEYVKLPDFRNSTVHGNLNSKECERECLKRCNCTGYAILYVTANGEGCITWYGDLTDMREYTDGQDFYLRVDSVELAANAWKKSKHFLATKDVLAFIVVPLASEVIPIIACIYYCWKRHAKRTGQKKKQQNSRMLLLDSGSSFTNHNSDSINANSGTENGNIEITFFKLKTVIAATENFSSTKKLGRGGFGAVYKGQLPNGHEIAVKRLSTDSGQGIEEFKNEVLLIARLQHRNLVRLLGCCIEKDEKILIYEFMSNKSLDYFIFDQSRKLLLDWKMRFEIILGIVRGIVYLHQDSRLRIIHRDLKASNILLDEEMKPKISDFGIARIFGGDKIQENTRRVVGTFGYMSPEYIIGGIFSMKSDVFSFGVILLEIICGKKNCGFYHESSSSTLLKYIWELWRDDKAMEIVDSCIADVCPAQEVLRCIQVGLLCVQDDARDRPTMSTVIFMLSNEAILPSPKQSEFAFRRNAPQSSAIATNCSDNEVTITTFIAR